MYFAKRFFHHPMKEKYCSLAEARTKQNLKKLTGKKMNKSMLVLILYDQVPMSTSKACLRVCLQNTTGSLSDYDLFAVGTGIDDTDQIASEIMVRIFRYSMAEIKEMLRFYK